MSSTERCMRVKIYCLADTNSASSGAGVWMDRGTGFAGVERGCLVVLRETEEQGPAEALLISRIRMDDAYERQGPSIIMWRESAEVAGAEHDVDFALSFQDSAGCNAIWDMIAEAQGRYMRSYAGFVNAMDEFQSRPAPSAALHEEPRSLPEVSVSNLKEIKDCLVSALSFSAGSPVLRESYARIITDKVLVIILNSRILKIMVPSGYVLPPATSLNSRW